MVSKKKDENNSVKSTKKVTAPVAEEVATFVPRVEIDLGSSPYGVSGREGMLESTEVYDEADIASALEQGLIAQALANHRHKVAPEKHPDFDGVHCVDCEVQIPQGRLQLGKVRCVDCQSELEHINKINGRR